jgi:hypothetical protein
VESFQFLHDKDKLVFEVNFSRVLEITGAGGFNRGAEGVVTHVEGGVGGEHLGELVPAGGHGQGENEKGEYAEFCFHDT